MESGGIFQFYTKGLFLAGKLYYNIIYLPSSKPIHFPTFHDYKGVYEYAYQQSAPDDLRFELCDLDK